MNTFFEEEFWGYVFVVLAILASVAIGFAIVKFEQNSVARAYHRLMSFMGRDQNVDTGLQISQRDFTNVVSDLLFFAATHGFI